MGQAGEDIAQIGVGIEAPAATTFHQGVEDGAASAGLGFTNNFLFLLKKNRSGMEHTSFLFTYYKLITGDFRSSGSSLISGGLGSESSLD